MPACRFIVTGKVQGVFFRTSAREQGRCLGLRGHARNLPDGSVEVVAVGGTDAIEALAVWLRHGPPMAKVEAVHRSTIDSDIAADASLRDHFVFA